MVVSLSPLLLFDVVIDVEAYPEFLPWCTNVSVISSTDSTMDASLSVSFGGISSGYISKIEFKKPTKETAGFVKVTSTEGAFKYLYNLWEFIPQANNSCLVKFNIEYEFKSKALQCIMSLVYKKAQKKIISAFRQRAELKAKTHSKLI